MNKKVIIVHPGRQHSFQLAEALKESNMLCAYVTTVYNKKYSLTSFVGKFLKGDNKKRFLGRYDSVFDENVFQYYELLGLVVIFLRRFSKLAYLGNKIDNWITKKIYYKAIRLAEKKQANAIVFFAGLTQKHIDFARKKIPDVKLIVDVPTPSTLFWIQSIKRDLSICNDKVFKEQESALLKIDTNRFKYGALNADGFLVGSYVVSRSLQMYGIEKDKIAVVPYGINTATFFQKEYESKIEKVKFLFVGQVVRRKGIHHLLNAFTKLPYGSAELTLVGKYDSADVLYKENFANPNIHFIGLVTKDKVSEFYRENDVFVFPSLCDGMGQVGIESMASGIPSICSDNSGYSEIVTDGVDGFVVETSNEAQLFEKMKWFIENKNKIAEMGKKACETGRKYTWDRYKQLVAKTIQENFD